MPSISLELESDATSYSQPAWYAAYTCSRREKQVARILQQRDFECFLPLYETKRGYSHRSEPLLMPLFPGYVFVHIKIEERLGILQVPGVVKLVGSNGKATALQNSEIQAIRDVLTHGFTVEPYPYLKANHQVEICNGPLQGLKGRILRRKGHFRVVLSMDLLQRSVAVDVAAADLIVGAPSYAECARTSASGF